MARRPPIAASSAHATCRPRSARACWAKRRPRPTSRSPAAGAVARRTSRCRPDGLARHVFAAQCGVGRLRGRRRAAAVRGLPARGGRAAMAVAGWRRHARPDAAGQGTPGAGPQGFARRRRALGNRRPGGQPDDHGGHDAAGDRRHRPRGRRPAGQGPQAGQRHGGRSQAPHRARCVLGPEVRWPPGRLGPSPAATATC